MSDWKNFGIECVDGAVMLFLPRVATPADIKTGDELLAAVRDSLWQFTGAPLSHGGIHQQGKKMIAQPPAALVAAMTTGNGTSLPDFLDWLADRLVSVHGDSPHVDYVLTARRFAKRIREALPAKPAPTEDPDSPTPRLSPKHGDHFLDTSTTPPTPKVFNAEFRCWRELSNLERIGAVTVSECFKGPGSLYGKTPEEVAEDREREAKAEATMEDRIMGRVLYQIAEALPSTMGTVLADRLRTVADNVLGLGPKPCPDCGAPSGEVHRLTCKRTVTKPSGVCDDCGRPGNLHARGCPNG